MSDVKHMVPGFNHNFKHLGKAYHVQTEDSGIGNPHVITHLFMGGNVLASKKTSYADAVGAENLSQVVRELMEDQHKEMLRNLINGVYDNIDAALAKAYQPGQLSPDLPRSPEPMRAPAPAAAWPLQHPLSPRAASPAPAPVPRAAPASAPRATPVLAPRATPLPAPRAAPLPAARAAPLPSPRAVLAPAPAPRGAPSGSALHPPPIPPRLARTERLGALPQPPAKPIPGDTLFGQDLSEKSLDEVILSYLAGERGGRKP